METQSANQTTEQPQAPTGRDSVHGLLALFPPHKCSLEITHNKHRDYHETAEERIRQQEGYECPPAWRSEEEKARAIATNELWEMDWYPDTPIGSYSICAPTLEELLDHAREISEANNDVLMDKLQDEGLVSDLCVTLEDVADRDLVRIWGEIGASEQ